MKKLSAMLFLLMVFVCIFAVTASAKDVFVSEDGVIPDFTGTVYTSVGSAIADLGSEGGTVYIEGTAVLPATPDTSAFSGKTLTFRGYKDSADGNTAEIKCAAKAFLPTAPADIVFDNITVKVQDGNTTETWISPNGGSITFGSGCLYEHGYRASKDLDLRLHIGPYTGATKGGTVNFNSPVAEYAEVGSLAGYITGSTSNYTVNGDVIY
ncbi:MAG: hypothetical protein IKV97_00195, partial [Clostridia bacterium]|nr:hypothetical protein [Clostridia bacterium]